MEKMFKILGQKFSQKILWKRVNFFFLFFFSKKVCQSLDKHCVCRRRRSSPTRGRVTLVQRVIYSLMKHRTSTYILVR